MLCSCSQCVRVVLGPYVVLLFSVCEDCIRSLCCVPVLSV